MSTSAAVGPGNVAAQQAEGLLLEHEVYALLASAGIGVPAHRLVSSPAEIDAAVCAGLGSDEAVVKVVSPEILHKSDVGGVAFCANTPAAVKNAVAGVIAAAIEAHPQAHITGELVVERIAASFGLGGEILGGFRHDPAFGPVVVVGVGGLDTEFLLGALQPDAGRAVLAAEGLTAERVLARLRGTVVHAAFTGALRSRHGQGLPESRLVELVLALAQLARTHAGFLPAAGQGIQELEVNPFVATRDGRVVALDGLARLHRPQRLPEPRPLDRLTHLLRPTSAVVIGASSEGVNAGRVILRNLIEGGGLAHDRVWAVHPRVNLIDGCRAFASLAELPEPADLAIVAVAADKGAADVVLELVEQRRARTVTLIAGGFGETEAGRESEQRLRLAIDVSHRETDGGVLVNGGNCLGIVSDPGGYSSFFIPHSRLPFDDAPGRNVAAISQSGAYLVSLISNLARAVRPRYAISFGNQIDLTAGDYLRHLAEDPEVKVFAVYLEGFARGDGAAFLDAARQIVADGRTVLLYKAGRTAEGGAAAASHTAAAVGDYAVCRELVRAAGVLECATLDVFEDALVTFSFLADRSRRGKRVAVLSNAGFECTAAADRLYGMQLARFGTATRRRLTELLPAGVVDVHNPVDTTPSMPTERYVAALEVLLEDPDVDAVVVAGVPATPYLDCLPLGGDAESAVFRAASLPVELVRVFRSTSKPMVFSVDAGALYDPFVALMMHAGLPCFRKVDRATRALAAFVDAGASK